MGTLYQRVSQQKCGNLLPEGEPVELWQLFTKLVCLIPTSDLLNPGDPY